MISRPRLLITGTHSGVGKTTVAVGLMATLAKRGVAVQPFKVGPDYIDPTYHALVTGRVSRNLDTWLLQREQVAAVFQHAIGNADVAIIEGVMGLFDGHGSTDDRGSTAELAKWLQAPTLLVVDASRMAGSAAAVVQGYATLDPDVQIAGVIFNNVSERHYDILREALRRHSNIPPLGFLPHDPQLAIPERHLGLVPAQEGLLLHRAQERLAEQVARSVDLEAVMRIATQAPLLPSVPSPWTIDSSSAPAVRIGLARDAAFHFYYQENLDLLRACGAELVEFSPLADARLPDGLDGLYLGGGFPEVFAEMLARNASLRHQVKHLIEAGAPTYAECGGLMYLAERLTTQEGASHAMVGALPGDIRMTDRLQHFGYVTVQSLRDSIVATAHDSIKGHEFHHSVWDYAVPSERAAYLAVNSRNEQRVEGYAHANVLASYIHVHFLTNTRWARGFVVAARRWKALQPVGTR